MGLNRSNNTGILRLFTSLIKGSFYEVGITYYITCTEYPLAIRDFCVTHACFQSRTGDLRGSETEGLTGANNRQ